MKWVAILRWIATYIIRIRNKFLTALSAHYKKEETMFGNQIIKHVGTMEKWKNESSYHQYKTFIEVLKRSHHFYFGKYADMESDIVDKVYDKRLFMDGLADNLKLPYDSFLLCFRTGTFPYNHDANIAENFKFAILVQRFIREEDVGITVEFLTTYGGKKWTLFPFTRLYLFNQTLEEGRKHWEDIGMEPLTFDNIPLYNTNSGIFSMVSKEQSQEFIDPVSPHFGVQQVMAAVLNYFLILYNQKYIVTETIHKDKVKKKRKKNKTRLFDYKILCVKLPKSGKKYRYDNRDIKSKGIMPFSEVPGIWKTYTEDGPMFGNPKLVGDFWVPAHIRGSKQAGFVNKDYCVEH